MKWVIGNWKMNGLSESLHEARSIGDGIGGWTGKVVSMVCPPATLIARMAMHCAGTALEFGGQDCHAKASGAHTGDIAAEMLHDAGARAVILGHSERRTDHGETSEQVRAKVDAAWRAALTPIVCVGEVEAERDAGRAEAVVEEQLAASLPDALPTQENEDLIVAYEPVWAIGTGRVPTEADIGAMHGQIRAHLVKRYGEAGHRVPILYGGSMKPDNAKAIMSIADVDGGLVGGASLKAESFLAIAEAAAAAEAA
ncbi:triose-phosphate isomerase [Afifella aestuarii]|uniref:triose-phosphate isomerase n=1 Tax=Afifella aestuarii TaxID=1909496 RepID=UPI000FE33B2B|nr:triose-phosphate isomerase [Afifella aestuarii]